MEETFNAGQDLTTPSAPPITLRAEIVPANAQGHSRLVTHLPTTLPHTECLPKHFEGASGHLAPGEAIKSLDKFHCAPQEQKDILIEVTLDPGRISPGGGQRSGHSKQSSDVVQTEVK